MSDTIAIDYKVVGNLTTTMETLNTKGNTLKGELDNLKQSLSSNWVGADAQTLITNYDEFVSNIDIITQDITSVKDWCNDTMAAFKANSSSNSQKIANAMSGK